MTEPNANTVSVPQVSSRSTRARTWIRRRRNAILSSAVRGTAYGIGAGAGGLLFWWIRDLI
ncbi:hypothetical protein [Streptomyces sp. NPDC006638]|uniref:hypothetical protein n=1 Tax=Streptomyces sp. NPDC006638 TaxID=3157183 RepID=UPI0033B1FF92